MLSPRPMVGWGLILGEPGLWAAQGSLLGRGSGVTRRWPGPACLQAATWDPQGWGQCHSRAASSLAILPDPGASHFLSITAQHSEKMQLPRTNANPSQAGWAGRGCGQHQAWQLIDAPWPCGALPPIQSSGGYGFVPWVQGLLRCPVVKASVTSDRQKNKRSKQSPILASPDPDTVGVCATSFPGGAGGGPPPSAHTQPPRVGSIRGRQPRELAKTG